MRYNQAAVRIIRSLPGWARSYDAATRTWRVHPGHAHSVAASLTRIGYTIVGVDLDRIA